MIKKKRVVKIEILLSESDKRIVKWGVTLLRMKLGEQAHRDEIHDDMQNCGNMPIKIIDDIVNNAASFIKCQHQKVIVTDLTELALWVCYKDTAYRDIFFYILDELLQHADEVRELIKPYVKPPEEWHVNVWTDSVKKTEEQRKEGKILKTQFSVAESVHVPEIQRRRLTKIINKEIRR